ncbi:hypothetical protein ABT095_15045 [Kitasatospora sp. NPDC002227]|uniref:hypothetical protein n=1 Tax=Kitasatospora sp. NPDC002227 TaxID=3154773 RepID=UPI00331FCE67
MSTSSAEPGAIAPEDIRPGDTVEALNTSSSNPKTFRLTVDRTPWRVNSTTTALTDGTGMYDAQTASLRLIGRPHGPASASITAHR